jgi:photosystem II stability/assembly factor-like uncharacterized protein
MSFASGDPDADARNPKTPGDASVRPETDDATARREAMRQWYETPFTAEYTRWLNDAAARERERNGALLPGGNGEAPVSGTLWVNLGPNKADFIKNGGTTLQKTDAGRPVAIVPNPINADILYVAMAGGGVWKTVNATAAQPTWTPITESLGSLSCGALGIDWAHPATIYLGLGDSFDGTGIGLVKSTDGGAHWGSVVYLGDSTHITDIHVAHNNSSVVLATTDAGLFRSINGGASFTKMSFPGMPTVPNCWSIAWGGAGNYVVSLEADPFNASGLTNGQIWYSSNNGLNWTRATGVTKPSGVGRLTVGSSPANRTVMYVEAAIPNNFTSTDLADFFRSADGGHTWTAMNATAPSAIYSNPNSEATAPNSLLNGQGWYNQLVIPSKADPNTVFFGGALTLAKATSAATVPSYAQVSNWLAQFSLPYVHADFHCGAYDKNGNLFVGTDGGIFRSSDGGTTWTDKFNIGIVSHLLYSVGSSEADPAEVIGGLQDNGTRVRSGTTTTFNQTLGGDGFDARIHSKSANLMLGTLYYDRIFKSTNSGATFNAASSGIAESNDSANAPFITRLVPWAGATLGNTVLTFSNTKVYRTTNYAGSWSPLGTSGLLGNPASGVIRHVGIAKSNGNIMGVVANGGRIYLSNSGGSSWTAAAPPPNNAFSMSYISFDPAHPLTVYVASVAPDATASHLWKSLNLGVSWTSLDSGAGFPTGVPVNTIVADPNAPATLYAGTHLGVYRSQNGGSTWARFGSGMPLVNVTDFYIAPNSNRMRAATYGRGFWQLNP